MNTEQAKVKKWMETFGEKCFDKPTTINNDACRKRAELILEECIETIEGLGFRLVFNKKEIRNKKNSKFNLSLKLVSGCSLSDIIDGLGDISYVTYGTANILGVDMEPVFTEIHRSNETKFWSSVQISNDPRIKSGELTATLNNKVKSIDDLESIQSEEKYAVRDKNGKLVKPDTFSSPDIEGILYKQSL